MGGSPSSSLNASTHSVPDRHLVRPSPVCISDRGIFLAGFEEYSYTNGWLSYFTVTGGKTLCLL